MRRMVKCKMPGVSLNCPSGANFCAEYQAVYDAFVEIGDKPTDAEADKQNALVQTLVNGDIWQILDVFRIYGVHKNDNDEIFWNWVNLGNYTATELAAYGFYTFTANHGVVSTSSNWGIDSNFNPRTAGGNFAKNDASMGVFCWDDTGHGFDMGAADTISSPRENAQYSTLYSGARYSHLNDNSALSPAGGDGTGMHIQTRTGTHKRVYRNNVLLQEDLLNTITDMPNLDLYEFTRNLNGARNNPCERELGVLFFGGYITPAQVTILTNAVNTYFGI